MRVALEPSRRPGPVPPRPRTSDIARTCSLPIGVKDYLPAARPLIRPRAPRLRKYERVFPSALSQVREARGFLAGVLHGCALADDAVLCLSELAANAVRHSSSPSPSPHFTVRAYVRRGAYVCIEVHDEGGPWNQRSRDDDRAHGLDIVRELADVWGADGDALTGWRVWARFDWPAPDGRHTPDPPHPPDR